MRILAEEAASTILLCSSSLRSKEIIFKTIPSFLGCHLFVCSEDFSVTLWSLLFVFNLCAPNHNVGIGRREGLGFYERLVMY